MPAARKVMWFTGSMLPSTLANFIWPDFEQDKSGFQTRRTPTRITASAFALFWCTW